MRWVLLYCFGMGVEFREIVRDLRRNQTEAESVMWKVLRGRRLNEKKFIRQYPVAYVTNKKAQFFVLDFYCSLLKLGIEIDGSIHDDLKEKDEQRTNILQQKGIRISNCLAPLKNA